MRKRKNAVDRSVAKEIKPEIIKQQFKEGDLTWVEIHNSSWWPAQVVDERCVADKPKKKSNNELLVRLYGTCEYMYVDASKSNSEFEDILKRENKTMKEKFQEALEEDMSLMLPKKRQSELQLSTLKGKESAAVSKDMKQQSELSQQLTGIGADKISTVCANKEKTEGSSKQKRKLDVRNEESDENQTKPPSSKAETPNSKKQKVVKHADSKSHGSSIVRTQHVPFVEETSSRNSVMKEAIYENQEEMKAKDLEIRKIVRDVLFGGPPKYQTPTSSKDVMRGGTSNPESSGLMVTYSRKTKGPKQGGGEIKSGNRKHEGVKGLKEAVTEILRTPNSNISKKSRAEKATPKLTGRNLKENSKARADSSKHVKTPAEVKDITPEAEEKGLRSDRQIRVMQSLALIAPTGSPFGRNGSKI